MSAYSNGWEQKINPRSSADESILGLPSNECPPCSVISPFSNSSAFYAKYISASYSSSLIFSGSYMLQTSLSLYSALYFDIGIEGFTQHLYGYPKNTADLMYFTCALQSDFGLKTRTCKFDTSFININKVI